jgi:hypothetical protein
VLGSARGRVSSLWVLRHDPDAEILRWLAKRRNARSVQHAGSYVTVREPMTPVRESWIRAGGRFLVGRRRLDWRDAAGGAKHSAHRGDER